ncbi:Alpha-N-acetylgalactosaminide alpha-2,6-sialyltransferase 1 [Galemys pyrenaicus]|uniref:alpha-N-acetylgalactosaminide alpha-2,6-sialyltransferase n=1 Tax=Galemys pyrenaicus TaxID=202257 RepID=A0A8J6DSU6_GALPY|nr:Alpha-N-acetylgalactosaminide alpha-2,6-sialyltransferase 1 [Galemys pyrenaicus]
MQCAASTPVPWKCHGLGQRLLLLTVLLFILSVLFSFKAPDIKPARCAHLHMPSLECSQRLRPRHIEDIKERSSEPLKKSVPGAATTGRGTPAHEASTAENSSPDTRPVGAVHAAAESTTENGAATGSQAAPQGQSGVTGSRAATKEPSRAAGSQAAPQGQSGVTGSRAATKEPSRAAGSQAAPQGQSGVTGSRAATKEPSRGAGSQAAPQGQSGVTGSKVATKGQSGAPSSQEAPKGQSGTASSQVAPQGQSKAPSSQAAPKGQSGAPSSQAAPKGQSKAPSSQEAPKEQSGVPGTARTASLSQEEETVAGKPSPRSQEQATVSGRTSLDLGTTKGRGHPTERPPATRAVSTKPQSKVAARAGTQPPGHQARPSPRAPQRGAQGASTAAAPPRETPRAPPRSPLPQRLKATDFKFEPKWDFEEAYSMDNRSLQTTCPDSVKVKASKSPWLQNLFLPNLTVFLDSTRFNESEWNRLEHFKTPYGFMELNYSVVQDVVARFPRVPQQQLLLADLPPGSRRCLSCAVVGNGGILNGSRKGQEIDSHDYVFRLSGAVIKDYEQDVGTRTSFYGFTAFSLTQSLLILGRRGFQHVPMGEHGEPAPCRAGATVGRNVRYLHFLEGSRDFDWLQALLLNQPLRSRRLWFSRNPRDVFPKDMQLDRYFLLHPDLLRYIKNRFLRSKTLSTSHWRIYRPTTGALLLLTALQLCDQVRLCFGSGSIWKDSADVALGLGSTAMAGAGERSWVSAYGFITEGHEHFSDHYYDKTWKKTVFYINHDFGLERKVWKQLHDEGIIRLYQRPMPSKAKV